MATCIKCGAEVSNKSYKYCWDCLAVMNGQDTRPKQLRQTTTKVCARCHETKPVDEFYHYKGRPISYCRPCNKEYHYEDHHKRKTTVQGTVGSVEADLMSLGPQLRGMVIEAEDKRRQKAKKQGKFKGSKKITRFVLIEVSLIGIPLLRASLSRSR